jgi:Tol biopolymer transport system component
MGASERPEKGQSFQFAYKNIAAFVVLVAAACGHKATSLPASFQQALNNPNAPALNVSSLGIQLTQSGSNDSPFLSANGKKVIYVSRSRPGHAHGQIYIYDLDTLKERRVTYQDGECRDPIFLLDSKRLIYASTTDELKEKPLLLRPKETPATLPFTELYLSDESGSDIDRLTDVDGFDGFAWPRWDRPQSIIFSRQQAGFLAAYQMNLETKQSIPLLSKKDVSIESLQLSPDKKQWAWIERTAGGASQVWMAPFNLGGSKQLPLALPPGDYKEVQWMSPHRLLLTAKMVKRFFQFYSYNLEASCLQTLFDSNSDLSSPRLTSEGQALVFRSFQGGANQIFYKTLPQPSENCIAADGASGWTTKPPAPTAPPPQPRKKRR